MPSHLGGHLYTTAEIFMTGIKIFDWQNLCLITSSFSSEDLNYLTYSSSKVNLADRTNTQNGLGNRSKNGLIKLKICIALQVVGRAFSVVV